MPTGFVVLIVAIVVAGMLLGWLSAQQRRKTLAAWGHDHGLSFSPGRRDGLRNEHADFNCLRQGHSQYAYNILAGPWRGRDMLGFDYHYVTGSGKNRATHRFSAVILSSPVRLEPLLIRPEGFLDKVAEFFGYDDIDFESAEFSRRFYVKAPDKRWAYDVVHPRAMQLLLAGPRFSIQFAPSHVIAYRSSRLAPEEFLLAATLVCDLLEALPDYLLRQQTGQG